MLAALPSPGANTLSIGPFVRGQFLIGEGDKIEFIAFGGVSFSLAFGGAQAVDTDGDTLSDEREVAEHQTDPNNPDTDGDGIPDGSDDDTNAGGRPGAGGAGNGSGATPGTGPAGPGTDRPPSNRRDDLLNSGGILPPP